MSPVVLVIGGIVALLAGAILFGRRRFRLVESRSRVAFDQAYSSLTSQPHLQVRMIYGFPAFEVTFRDDEALSAAVSCGANAAFTAAVQAICRSYGSKSEPYNAKRAIYFHAAGRN